MQTSYPMFLTGYVIRNHLQEMFGSLQIIKPLAPDGNHGIKKLLSNPVVVSTIQTPYRNYTQLWNVLCNEDGTIWTSGEDNKIYEIDQAGLILKSVSVSNTDIALSLNMEKQLLFSIGWSDTKVFKYDEGTVRIVVDLRHWCPRGLCHSANGDLLVSMRSIDKSQSKVVQYSGTTETMVVQNDRQGKPLFSVGVQNVLLLTESGKGDICVADNAKEAVVVVKASGELRYKYNGNISFKLKYRPFKPTKIATDIIQQIVINDESNDIVHIIDSDGNFLRYIKYPCKGGLSFDGHHNLVIGERKTGIIRIIKYLK